MIKMGLNFKNGSKNLNFKKYDGEAESNGD